MADHLNEGHRAALKLAYERAVQYRARSADAPVRPVKTAAQLRELFDVGLPAKGRDPSAIIRMLADASEEGLIGITSPHFYGWVMGASHPVGLAAEFLVASWGQNAGIYKTAPANAIAEEVAGAWLLDLLDLPRQSSIGFSTGATMASFICMSAARTDVLHKIGWDLEQEGLIGAPEVKVFLSEQAHATIHSGLRYLGFGERQKVSIASDDQCAMATSDLAAKLKHHEGPKIIISQAGHINSGAFDAFGAISDLAAEHSAWHHVDGAFGLWVRAVPEKAHFCQGIDRADSWAVDGHKWLQVPYDSGFAIVKEPEAHKRAMDTSASYIARDVEDGKDPSQFGPELSRRARGFAAWATIQALGREGVEEMVSRHCSCADHLAKRLEGVSGVTVLNDVVINQVAIAFGNAEEPDEVRSVYARNVVDEIQRENAVFAGGAVWKGLEILRISIISRTTDISHIDLLADEIVRAWGQVKG